MKRLQRVPRGVSRRSGCFSIFCCCVLLFAAQQSTAQQTTDPGAEHYARGRQAMQIGLYDDALAAFEQALQLNLKSAEIYCELGAVYRFKERTDTALEMYRTALASPARSAETYGVAHLCLARLYHAQGRFADAENHGRHATDLLPNTAEAFFRLADTYVQRGKLEAAAQTYQQARALDATLAPIYHGLGKVAFLQERFADAEKWYREALARDPYHVETHYTLALVYQRLAQRAAGTLAEQHVAQAKRVMTAFQQVKAYDEQTNRYRRRLLAAPTALEPRLKLAAAHLEIGNHPEAIRAYRTAIALHPDRPSLYHNLGGIYMQTGAFEKAVSAFQQVLALDRTDAEASLHLGWLHARQGKFADAQTYLHTAIQHDPNLTPAYYGLAEVYAQQHLFSDALAVYAQLTTRAPAEATAWVRQGVLLLKQEQTAAAIHAFTQAIAVDDTTADAHNNLAWLYATQGQNLEQAVELAERAVSLDLNASRLDTLAYVYYRYGALLKAEQAILRAIALQPNHATYTDRLNTIRQAMEAEKR